MTPVETRTANVLKIISKTIKALRFFSRKIESIVIQSGRFFPCAVSSIRPTGAGCLRCCARKHVKPFNSRFRGKHGNVVLHALLPTTIFKENPNTLFFFFI
ncbi:hypothetical protein SXCC_00144 [Gluconacetobacter sp. SXCC-1]|nr:hypothetical protein SXCC_00144 [Gluconacetobacter sp. SXCC-1]